jgi:hypothetical protein
MDTVKICDYDVSRLILGSNPFSGFSHQSVDRDDEMRHYYTCERIKEVLRNAESLGINTIIARGDHHMVRVLMEYWDEGGTLQWFGQTCPEVGTPENTLGLVARRGAVGCHIHGGYADHVVAAGDRGQELVAAVEFGRQQGLVIGMAGHATETIRWAEENLDLDYYMCSYYNPIERKAVAEHRPGTDEKFRPVDRKAMTVLIQTLPRPVIHYKVMAAGRNDPAEAFDYVARSMRAGDACCVGVFPKDDPDMLARDVELFEAALARHAG